jgi:hypothetical protein
MTGLLYYSSDPKLNHDNLQKTQVWQLELIEHVDVAFVFVV